MFRATSATDRPPSMTKLTASCLYSRVKLRRVETIYELPTNRAATHGGHRSGNGPRRLGLICAFALLAAYCAWSRANSDRFQPARLVALWPAEVSIKGLVDSERPPPRPHPSKAADSQNGIFG